MSCAAGCGETAAVLASRDDDGLIVPLCTDHGRLAEAMGARVRPLVSRRVRAKRREGA